MLGFVLGLGLAASASAAEITREPDLRCVAAVSAALGIMGERKDADAETMSGLTAVFMYYLGKVDARHPGLDYAPPLAALMNAPGYAAALPDDLKRCGTEAEERGRTLRILGEQLKAMPPLVQRHAG